MKSIAVFLILFVLAIASLADFNKNYSKVILQGIKSLNFLAENYKNLESIYRVDYTQLQMVNELNEFDYTGIADRDGNTIDRFLNRTNISQRDYFIQAMQGKIVITDLDHSLLFPDSQVQITAVPIYDDNKNVVGLAFGISEKDSIAKGMNLEQIGDIYLRIVDSNGTYISDMP